MCVAVIAWRAHANWPLILAGNRDEFHARPSASATWWDDAPKLLAGRDLVGGGTWLGIRHDGRFAVVTNYRDPNARGDFTTSRGRLVTDYLLGTRSPAEFAEHLGYHADEYSGFNLLVGDTESLHYAGNRNGSSRKLDAGVYGLSNHLLNSPWPKVERVRTGVERLLHKQISTDALMALLDDREPAPYDALPDTGVGLEVERLLSAPFVVSPEYGTRSSTVLLIDTAGDVTFTEHNHDCAGTLTGKRCYEFALA